ncbi:hypothetical protein [Lysobacter arvi]|uniref:Uncharacterized protein n=1 Tax=Lysobacter arvi TaxID=3038776 RepID=A0ABU1CAB8_9GAMM|nr:hypothetical protein [Lysobacter arvi]MDR0182133.1 hypothetical protein [Lysobacter arvi]
MAAAAVEATTFGVSAFRSVRSYPPSPSEDTDADPSINESLFRLKRIPLVAECMPVRGPMFHFKKYPHNTPLSYGDGLAVGTNEDLTPMMARKVGGNYFVVFMHPSYSEGDGEGDELSASLAVYDKNGRLTDTVEKISSWRSYESTIILLDACVSADNITITKALVYPDAQDAQGKVLSYEAPEVQVERVYSKNGDHFASGDLTAARQCVESNYR